MRLIALLFPLALVSCFGSVQIVPAAQAPAPPSGSGWHCVDYAVVSSYGARTHSACFRDGNTCRTAADQWRSEGQVGFCEEREKAACTVVFTNQNDGRPMCFASLDECQGQVGGMAGVPGTKQSECAEYN